MNTVESQSFSGAVATFTDAYTGAPIADYSATINWGDGTSSAGVISNGSVFGSHTYTEEGSYSVRVTVNDVGGSTASAVSTFNVADAPLVASGGNLSLYQGNASSQVLAYFSEGASDATSEFSATITWGDGSTSSGSIVEQSSGQFAVEGSHTYNSLGTLTATITIRDVDSTIATVSDSVVVLPSPVIAMTEGEAFNGVVSSFQGAWNTSSSNYTATIDWGDGTTSAGTVSKGLGSTFGSMVNLQNFNLNGSHAYQEEGTYSITATIHAPSSLVETLQTKAVVADAPLITGNSNTTQFQAVEASSYNGTVARFRDSDLGGTTSDYAATIYWGDGQNSTGTLAVDPNGGFDVIGSHVYSEEGFYSVTASIRDLGGSITTALGTAQVLDAPLSAAGTTFNATEGTTFTGRVASFTDADPNGTVSDYTATITWGDGQTSLGTITADPNGGFDVSGTVVYGEEGSYAVGVKIHDTGGSVASTGSTAKVADAPLSATGLNVQAVEGSAFSGVLATFTDPGLGGTNPQSVPNDYSAIISWGNGQTSTGTIVPNESGGFNVSGNFTYPEEGSFAVSVTIRDPGGSAISASSTAAVADAPLTSKASSISATGGQAFDGEVATFTDAAGSVSPPSYTVTINWGDGQTSAGTVVSDPNGGFEVYGSHTFAQSGTYSVNVAIADPGGSTTTVQDSATVSDAPLTSSAQAINATEGVAFTGVVATFTDSDPSGTVGEYTATIDWGDGQTSLGSLAANPKGGFSVAGSHEYLEDGTYPISVSITDSGGATTSSSNTAIVNDEPLTATAINFSASALASFSGTVATFTEGPGDPIGDFSATIDWGDGTTSAGAIVAPTSPTASFKVNASHAYANGGSFAVRVKITDSDGAVVVANGTSTVSGLAANSIAATEGIAFSGVVTSFSAPSGSYSASINWGDGHTSTGTVASNTNGGYNVSGSNTYADEGSYPITVTITSSSGSTTATGMAIVADAPLTATGASLSMVEGLANTNAIVSFVDSDPSGAASDFTATISWGNNQTTQGTVVANSSGGFNVDGNYAYPEEGSYSISVTIFDKGGATATATSTAHVTDAPLTATALNISPEKGVEFTGIVASFVDSNPAGVASDYSATINWGDGNTSNGTITSDPNGGFDVTGTNTYASEGTFPISVQISDVGGSTTTAHGQANTQDLPLTPSGQSLTAVEGEEFYGIVASFTDADPNGAIGDFTATINWGDGQTSSGTISQDVNGGFDVIGSNTYPEDGTFTVQVQINDQRGSTATASSTATVNDMPLTATGRTYNLSAGSMFSGLVATFTEGSGDPTSSFAATISWGDGSSSTGVIASSGTAFTVSGSHTYTTPSIYAIQVAISDTDGATTNAVGQATVLSSSGGQPPLDPDIKVVGKSLSATEGSLFQGTVASFFDTKAGDSGDTYTAIINWGDGHISLGSITANSSGGYDVTGSNTFTGTGTGTATVTIKDADASGAVAQGQSGVLIVGAALTATGTTVSASTLTGWTTPKVVATFTDANPYGTVGSGTWWDQGNYRATIDWGDGTTSSGQLARNPVGGFEVLGEHQYLDGGAFPLTVYIQGNGGYAVAHSTANVTAIGIQNLSFNPGAALQFVDVGYGHYVPMSAGFTGGYDDSTSNFTATVSWGDGTTQTLPVSKNKALGVGYSNYGVASSHSYSTLGTYTITLTISEAGGSTATITKSVHVAYDVPLPVWWPAPVQLDATTGIPLHITSSQVPPSPLIPNWIYAPLTFPAAGLYGLASTSFDYENDIPVRGNNDFGLPLGYYNHPIPLLLLDPNTNPSTNGYTPTYIPLIWDTFQINGMTAYAPEIIPPVSESLVSVDVHDPSSPSGAVLGEGLTINAVEGTTANVNLVNFSGLGANSSDYTATISWGDGTTSQVTPNSSGQVQGSHTFKIPGIFNVPVTLTNNVTGQASYSFALVNVTDPPLAASSVTASGTSGVALNNITIATFTDPVGNDPPSDYQATINWGDGSTGAGIITGSGGSFQVAGSHTFTAAGTYKAQVTIRENHAGELALGGFGYDPTLNVAQTTSTLTIADPSPAPAPMDIHAVPISGNQGSALTNIVVGTFSDANPAHPVDCHDALIYWGDGSSSTGTIQTAVDGTIDILGTHTYAEGGSFPVVVTVEDEFNHQATASITAYISSPAMTLSGANQPGSSAGLLGTLSDPGATLLANYQATGVVIGAGGQYQIVGPLGFNAWMGWTVETGSDGYTTPRGSYVDFAKDGQQVQAVDIARYAPATVGVDVNPPHTIVDANGQTTTIGEPYLWWLFDNGLLNVSLQSYLTDWGDGSPPTYGTDHIYTRAGTYTVTETKFNQYGVEIASASAPITVGDGGLGTPQVIPVISGAVGTSLSGIPIAIFGDNDAGGSTSDFTATIVWGDGSSSAGTITAEPNHTFEVTGAHTYAEEGSFPVTVLIQDAGGSYILANTTANITDPQFVASGTNIGGLVGVSTGQLTLATVTDPDGAASDLTATINWGDGSSSVGVLSKTDSTHLAVLGAHTYWSSQSFPVHITINGTGESAYADLTAAIKLGGLSAQQRTSDPAQGRTVDLGEASIALNTGSLHISLPLDFDQSPGTSVGGDPALVYSSDTVHVRPIVEATLSTNASDPVPTSIQVQLTWNDGTPQPWITFSTIGHSPGDSYLLAAQVASPVTQTGNYDWSIHIREIFASGAPVDSEASGKSNVVVTDSTDPKQIDPYGPGWGLQGVARLAFVCGGVLWLDGTGDGRFFTENGDGTYTDPPQDFGTLTQDQKNYTFTYTGVDQTIWKFNDHGLLTSVVDSDGVATTYQYDGSDRLTGIDSPDGGVTTLNYSGTLLSSISEPGNRVVTLTHDGNGNLTSITNVDGSTREMTYDSNHHMVNDQWGPLNATFTYDPASGVLTGINQGLGTSSQITPANIQGLQTSPAQGAANAVAVVEDALSRVTTYAIDAVGRPLRIDQPNNISESWKYNNFGQIIDDINPLGALTVYTYDDSQQGEGDLKEVDTPDGNVETFQYDPKFHEVTSETNSLGEVTLKTYDPSTGDLLTSTDPTGAVTTYTWSNGLLQSTTEPANADGMNRTTFYVYDSSRRLEATIDPKGGRTTYTYDSAGNPATVRDPDGNVTTTVYDARNRLIEEIAPAPSTGSSPLSTTMAYDSIGDLVSQTDPRGIETAWTYDQRGLKTSETVGAGSSSAETTTFVYDKAGEVVSTIDARGKETDYGYDADGRQIWVSDPDHLVTTTVYDAAGDVVSLIDSRLIETDYTYDSAGRETSVTVAVGTPDAETTKTVYDKIGNILSKTDPAGIETDFAYDKDNRLTTTTVGVGSSTPEATRTYYDADGNVASTVNALGVETDYKYDADDRLISETDAVGTSVARTTTTVYDADGHVIASIDARGIETAYTYDSDGRKITETDAVGTSLARTTTTVYDADGNVVASFDARGTETVYTYDTEGRQTALTEAANTSTPRTTTTVYDADGNVIARFDPMNVETTFAYDSAGRQTATTEGANTSTPRTTSTYYDADGNIASTVDARGVETDYAYDSEGREVSVTKGANTSTPKTTYTRYDADGDVVSTVDASGVETDYAYDAEGRQTSLTAAAGSLLARTTTTKYDASGDVTATIDALGNETDYTYDPLGRQATVSDPNHALTTTIYDANDNVISITDPDRNATTYSYDALNRRIEMTDALGHSATYVYDANDNLVSTTDRDGRRTDFTYDVFNRPTIENWYSASGVLADTIVHSYDLNDNLLSASNNNGTVAYTFTYDAFNRVSTEHGPFGTSLGFGYDSNDNVTSVTDSFGGATTSTYDAFNRMTTIQFSGPSQTTPVRVDFSYTPSDQVSSVTRFSDLAGTSQVGSSQYTYDQAERLTAIQHNGPGGGVLNSDGYRYDADNRVTSATENGSTKTYSYDPSSQLIGDGSATYTYDANGNRSSGSNVVSANNELASDGTWNYTYDNEGNLITKANIASGNTWTYTYNNANEMTSATLKDVHGNTLSQVSDVYDPFGNRIQEAAGTTTERFAYDGPSQTLWAVLDGSNHLATRYVNGNFVDQVLAEIGGSGTVAWFLTDELGSTSAVVDNTGKILDQLSYDSFGNVTSESNPSYGQLMKYTGQLYDAATGLYYDRARWYNSATGRWQTQDPKGFSAGDANLYRYVGNNPTDNTDPSGDSWLSRQFNAGYNAVTYAAQKVDQAAGVAGTFVLTGGSVVSMDSASATEILTASGTGALDGASVVVDTASFGTVARERSQRVQQQAIERGDTISAVGFGSARIGGHALQAIAIIELGIAAAPLIEGTTLGSVLTSSTAQTIGFGLTAGMAGYKGAEAVGDFAAGRIIDGIEHTGDAFLGTLFSRSMIPGRSATGMAAEGVGGAGKVAESEFLATLPQDEMGVKAVEELATEVQEARLLETLQQDAYSEGAMEELIGVAPKGPPNPGGRLGKDATRAQITDVANEMERRGYEITGGGGKLPEEYLPGPGGGRTGSSFPDITATKNGRTVRVNTIDTRADGITPTTREARNATRIRQQTPGDHLILIPKPK